MSIFSHNEQGLWCDVCGQHIADEIDLSDDDFCEPDTCKSCGFPDFENGAPDI